MLIHICDRLCENRCHRDACFPGYRVSRTYIPRDACFPAHISLTHLCLQVIVIYVSPGILFPRIPCADLQGIAAQLCISDVIS